MIEKGRAIMFTGGSSSGVAVAVQALCQEAGIIFMAGLTHSNDTTGVDRKANGFRHFSDSCRSGAAPAPVLASAYGTKRKDHHLTADYNWFYITEEAIRQATEAMGWKTVDAVKTPLTRTDFSSCSAPVLHSGTDVLVLNHHRGTTVNSLTTRCSSVCARSRPTACSSRSSCRSIPNRWRRARARTSPGSRDRRADTGSSRTRRATVTWAPTPSSNPSATSTETRRAGRPVPARCRPRSTPMPSTAPADSTPAPWARPSKGSSSTAWETVRPYRAADHQCFKDVVVVRVKENTENEFDLVEIVEVTPFDRVTYGPTSTSSAATAPPSGKCNPGA